MCYAFLFRSLIWRQFLCYLHTHVTTLTSRLWQGSSWAILFIGNEWARQEREKQRVQHVLQLLTWNSRYFSLNTCEKTGPHEAQTISYISLTIYHLCCHFILGNNQVFRNCLLLGIFFLHFFRHCCRVFRQRAEIFSKFLAQKFIKICTYSSWNFIRETSITKIIFRLQFSR